MDRPKQLTYITLLLYEKGYSLFAIDPSDFVEVDRTLFLRSADNVGKVNLVATYKEIGKFAYTLFTGKTYKKEADLEPLKGFDLLRQSQTDQWQTGNNPSRTRAT